MKKTKEILVYIALIFLGSIYKFSFSPFNILGVFLLSNIISLYFILQAKTYKKALLYGLVYGTFCSLSLWYWLVYPIVYVLGSKIIGILLLILAIGLVFVPSYLIVITAIYFYTKKVKNPLFKALFIAFIFYVLEFFYSKILFGGIPFFLAADIWSFDKYFLQNVYYVGISGLSFITFLMVYLLYEVIFYKGERAFFYKSLNLVIIVLILIVGHVTGLKHIAGYKKNYIDNFKAVIVQPNISQSDKLNDTDTLSQLNILKTLTSKVTKNKKENYLIIWPESAINKFLNRFSPEIKDISKLAGKNSQLITGGLRLEGQNYYNSAFIVTSNSFDFYDKMHLVPFGEYIPLVKYLANKFSVVSNFGFSEGTNNKEYSYNGYKYYISICYEILFLEDRKLKDNIDFMVNITNDAWYNESSEPYQHYNLAVIEAIATGIPIIRATNTGISAVISPIGEVISLGLNQKGVIKAKIPVKYSK